MSTKKGRRSSDGEEVEDTNPDAHPVSSRALVAHKKPPMFVAEAGTAARLPIGMASPEQLDGFRELRTRLLGMAQALGIDYFTTLIVPVSPGAGASFVARNLAAAFTLQERLIALLVDCNLRHPTQHLALGSRSDDGGLFDFLESPHAAFDRLVRPTGVPGLHLIQAGRLPAQPREYFSSQTMRMVMNALRQMQCYVFLDGPPCKGAPDARILSELVDFVILVTGYGRDTTDEIAQAAAMFDPAKFAGVVFNERH